MQMECIYELLIRATTYRNSNIKNANTVNIPSCLGSQPRGIILLGDSAGAHFHIPPEWLTASQLSVVSNPGSSCPGCAGLCMFALALSTRNANSKHVQISIKGTTLTASVPGRQRVSPSHPSPECSGSSPRKKKKTRLLSLPKSRWH